MKDAGLISPTEYQEGGSVLCDYGTWRLNTFTEAMEFDLLPSLKDGGERWSGLGLFSLSVVSTATNKDLAYDFAVHLATGKNSMSDEYYQYTFTKAHSLLPSLKAATETSNFKTETQTKFWEVSIEQLELSKYRPAVPCWPGIEELLSKAVSDALNGVKEPTEALNTAAKAADEMLSQYR